jgi:O-antigen ligase
VRKALQLLFLISLLIIGWGSINTPDSKDILLYGSTWEVYFPLFLLYAVFRCVGRDFRTGGSWKDPVLFFGIWAALSALWNPLRDLRLFQNSYLPALAGYFIFRYLLDRDFTSMRDRFFPFFCAAVSLMTVRGFLERFVWHATNTVDSTFMHHNHLAMSVMLGVPLALYLYNASPRHRAFYLINLVIMLLGLALSFSRSGWIAFMLIAVYLFWRVRDAGMRKCLVAVLLVFVVTLSFYSGTRARAVTVANRSDIGVRARLGMWKVSTHIFRDNPVMGIGFSDATYTMEEEYYANKLIKERKIGGVSIYNPHPHNLFIQVLLYLGMAGFLLFLWIICKVWLDLRVLEKAVQGEMNLVICMKASLIGFLAVNAIDTMFYNAQMVLFIFLFISVVFEWRKFVDRHQAPS